MKLLNLQGQNPYIATLGDEGDISNVCIIKWFEWVYYREGSEKLPFNQEALGNILGPAKNAGSEMAQWVLISKGTVVPHRSMMHLTHTELNNNPVEEQKRKIYMDRVLAKRGNSISIPPIDLTEEDVAFTPYENEMKPLLLLYLKTNLSMLPENL